MIKSVPITQMDMTTFANEGASILASTLGWENHETYALKPGTSSRLYITADNNTNGISIATGTDTTAFDYSSVTRWTRSNSGNMLDIIKIGSIAGFGIRLPSDQIAIQAFLAENEKGETKSFMLTKTSGTWLYRSEEETDLIRTCAVPLNTTGNIGVGLVKAPDIYGGCLFKDLYMIWSNPYTASNMIFAIGGKQYQQIGSTNMAVEITGGDVA